jgi:predicted ATPase with chaperone activity
MTQLRKPAPVAPPPSVNGGLISPPPPLTVEQLGLPPFMVSNLVLRWIREHGSGSLTMLRKGLKLSYPVVESTFQQLRQQQLIDIKSTVGSDFLFTLTATGRQFAMERSESCSYAGPAPVPIGQYAQVVRAQKVPVQPFPEQVRGMFHDLVLNDDILDRIGTALVSQRPLFIYGPSGNGKTSIIERLPRVYADFIFVPYAVEVDGQIISVFDPLVHPAVDSDLDDQMDERWVRCRRPCVMAAGELVPSMLETRRDARSGTYAAPLQMKASNGILLIDDFGRQIMSPRELFNRWILPLDRGVDYLSLEYGMTFQIPFELTLAFATNLEPSELADEAFLRRVPNKIYIGPISAEIFDEIFRRVLQKRGLPFEPELARYLRDQCQDHNPNGLRGCYPGDICEILAALAAYHRRPFIVNKQSLALATGTYFLNSSIAR